MLVIKLLKMGDSWSLEFLFSCKAFWFCFKKSLKLALNIDNFSYAAALAWVISQPWAVSGRKLPHTSKLMIQFLKLSTYFSELFLFDSSLLLYTIWKILARVSPAASSFSEILKRFTRTSTKVIKSEIIFCFSDCLRVLFFWVDRVFLRTFSFSRILAVNLIWPKSLISLSFKEFLFLCFSSFCFAASSDVMLTLGLTAGERIEERPDTMEQSRS